MATISERFTKILHFVAPLNLIELYIFAFGIVLLVAPSPTLALSI